MSKKTQHWIIAAAVGCYFIFLVGMIWYFNRDTGESATQTDATAIDVAGSDSNSADDSEIEMSEDFATLLENGLIVQFEGNSLIFPCDYTDVLNEDDGWEVHGNGLYDSAVSFGQDSLGYEVLLYMPAEGTGDFDTLESNGCSGIGISLLDGKDVTVDTAPMFTISWITWGDSKEDIVSAFGEPGYTNEIADDSGDVLYTYLLYQAEYEGRTYTMEFVTETGIGVVSMNFYYVE
ncbi:MAG: hypothetical protein LUE29_03765 [Lachnospiraceae bacterium]|nr:hypothetical protein [Lachnospiraceae bacterium]